MQFVLHIYVYVYFYVCKRLFSNVFTFLQIRKIEILPLILLTSSTTLVINELYGKSFALVISVSLPISTFWASDNSPTIRKHLKSVFNLTIQKSD